jgi:hypothetical protein
MPKKSPKSKALSKTPGTGLAAPNRKGGSLENANQQEDINIPRVKLMQPGTEEVTTLGLKAGNYFNKITNEEIKQLQITPMYLFKNRVFWDEDDNVICRSDNSLVSSQGLHAGEICKNCPSSKWGKNAKTGENIPPECVLINNFLAYTPEDLKLLVKGQSVMPKVVSFAKSAYGCSKDLISTCMYLSKDLYEFRFNIEGVMKQKDKYTYFVPSIVSHSETPEGTIAKLDKIFPTMRGLVQHVELTEDDLSDGDV